MSLSVPATMVEQAQQGKVSEQEFVAVIRESLPNAWRIVESLVERRDTSGAALEAFGAEPMDEPARGELLRMLAGTAIRRAVERHFGVELLFQNCTNVAVCERGKGDSAEAAEFTSIRSQILNQKPELVMC